MHTMPFVIGGNMKKNSVLCPLCGQNFDPYSPHEHIQNFHAKASSYQLALLRDARRKCFGQPKPIKKCSAILRSFKQVAPTRYKKAETVTAR